MKKALSVLVGLGLLVAVGRAADLPRSVDMGQRQKIQDAINSSISAGSVAYATTSGVANTALAGPFVGANGGTWTNGVVSGSLTGAGLSSVAPSAVANVGTLDTRYRWAQSYFIGQLKESTYGATPLTTTAVGGKMVVLYGTNIGVSSGVAVWSLPVPRLAGKSVVVRSTWVNYYGTPAMTNQVIGIRHGFFSPTNSVWVGGYPPYTGGNSHVISVVDTLTTVPSATNQFVITTTNTVPSNASADAEGMVYFNQFNDTTFGTNIALIAVSSEEIP